MGVSVFTDHLIEGLRLSRVEISTAYMIGTLISALAMTRAGIFYDRFGARVAASIAVTGLSLCLLVLSHSVEITSSLAELLKLPLGRVSFPYIVLGFLGIRFFGQGILTLVSRGMVMRWFEEHRGFASAFRGIFVSFSFSYAPRALQALINLKGWQGSWKVMGLFLICIALPFIIIFFRDSPEDCGIGMEEGIKLKHREKKIPSEPAHSLTLEEARKDPRLWCYMMIIGFFALYNTAFTFHITSIFASLGRNSAQAVSIFLPIAILSVVSGFFGNWISDFIDLKYHFYAFILTTALGAFALTLPFSAFSEILLISGFGLAGGFFNVLNSVTWPKLFGREHLGAISGMGMSFVVAGSALGPMIFSLMEKFWGDYSNTGWLGVGASLLLGLVSFPFLMKNRGMNPERQSGA